MARQDDDDDDECGCMMMCPSYLSDDLARNTVKNTSSLDAEGLMSE